MGYPITNVPSPIPATNNVLVTSHPLFNGPFGTLTSFSTWNNQGSYTNIAGYWTDIQAVGAKKLEKNLYGTSILSKYIGSGTAIMLGKKVFFLFKVDTYVNWFLLNVQLIAITLMSTKSAVERPYQQPIMRNC
jgi:hypothetical protein